MAPAFLMLGGIFKPEANHSPASTCIVILAGKNSGLSRIQARSISLAVNEALMGYDKSRQANC